MHEVRGQMGLERVKAGRGQIDAHITASVYVDEEDTGDPALGSDSGR